MSPGVPRTEHLVGVIADTHGLLRPEAAAALTGCEHIIHAGDVGTAEVLRGLAAIAPVTAVRGNVDRGELREQLADTAVVEVGGLVLYVLHDIDELDLDPAAAGIAAVLHGHSHRPRNEPRDQVLYFNPGSAGPRRFHLPVSVGRLHIAAGQIRGEHLDLQR